MHQESNKVLFHNKETQWVLGIILKDGAKARTWKILFFPPSVKIHKCLCWRGFKCLNKDVHYTWIWGNPETPKMHSSSKGTLKEEPKFQISVLTILLSVAVRILTCEFDCPYHGGASCECLDPEWGCFDLCFFAQEMKSLDSHFFLKPSNDLFFPFSFESNPPIVHTKLLHQQQQPQPWSRSLWLLRPPRPAPQLPCARWVPASELLGCCCC